MKTFRSFALITLVSLLIISCKKNDNNSNLPVVSNRIKTYSEDYFHSGTHNADSFNLTYNAGGQLELLQSKFNSGNKIVYTYQNNSFTQDFYTSNKLEIHSLFFLVNNVPDSFVQVNSTDTGTTKFLYNTAGQLIKMKEYDYKKRTGSVLFNTTSYVYDAFGNVIKDTDTYGNVNDYTYYLDQQDLIEFILPYYKYSHNLVKTQKYTSNGTVENITHTYTFDSQKRVSSDKEVIDNGDYVIKGYTYY